MPCGWKGNRRSGVALAMRHRLQWFIQLGVLGLRKVMITPSTLLMEYGSLYLYVNSDCGTKKVTLH